MSEREREAELKELLAEAKARLEAAEAQERTLQQLGRTAGFAAKGKATLGMIAPNVGEVIVPPSGGVPRDDVDTTDEEEAA